MQIERSRESARGSEADPVVAWRREQLLSAGFAPDLAAAAAAQPDVDIHALTELVELGCAPPLAVRILWPIDLRA
ncbi:MAG: hypothetical protein QOF43_1065 [Gaiellaceae bacterium]|nr:hypothetical protein [Gaiellaceae bacterium]